MNDEIRQETSGKSDGVDDNDDDDDERECEFIVMIGCVVVVMVVNGDCDSCGNVDVAVLVRW